MNVNKLHKVFFIGIGGIGMSALAAYLLAKGIKVFGYDRENNKQCQSLTQQGAVIQFDENLSQIESFENNDDHLVIYTPAVNNSNALLAYAQNNLQCIKRSALLAKVSQGHFTIAIAGTHGKTSTTALITHILKSAGIPICAFVGGVMRNYNSNVIIDNAPRCMILEADEFDRSFLQLAPNVAVITSVDPDHLDIYGNEAEFVSNFQKFAHTVSESLLVHKNIEKSADWGSLSSTYGVDFEVLTFKNHKTCFSIDEIEFCSNTPGLYSANNVMAAIKIAELMRIKPVIIQRALESYKGVERRYNVFCDEAKGVIIDDYAHHPEEIKAVSKATKNAYPNKKLNVFFQPHLFSRTRDFLEAFASALSLADNLFLLPIYPAREEPIDGVTSQALAELCTTRVKVLVSDVAFKAELKHNHKPDTVNLILGAGSIGRFLEEFFIEEVLC